jgi:hypothetical protein
MLYYDTWRFYVSQNIMECIIARGISLECLIYLCQVGHINFLFTGKQLI